jgi:hypothetical protein
MSEREKCKECLWHYTPDDTESWCLYYQKPTEDVDEAECLEAFEQAYPFQGGE